MGFISEIRRDRILAHLELPSFLEFLHITLTLQRAPSGKEDILRVPVNIFLPMRKPSHSIVVDDLAPVTRNVGPRNGCVIPDVNRDILRTKPQLNANDAHQEMRRSREISTTVHADGSEAVN